MISLNKERYTRAFNRFLSDNPDIDIDEAEKEFNELYHSGLYKIDDEFDKAEVLYEEAADAIELDDSINLLHEAIATCPYHYDSKILLALLEENNPLDRIKRLEDIREEFKKWLLTRNIDLDKPGFSIWLNLESRPYIRLLSAITDECISCAKYNEARKFSEMQYRLDKENIVDSLYDYAFCVALTGKYEYALSLIKDYVSSSRYLYLMYYINIALNNNKEAFEIYKTLFKLNPYYCSFLSGFFDVNEDEISEILNQDILPPDSFEESVYYITKCLPLTETMYNKMDVYLDKYYNKQINLLITMPDDEVIILARVTNSEAGLTLKELENLFKLDNNEIDHDKLLRKINKLIKRKYLEKRNKKYYITRLTYFIMKAATNTK